MSQINISETEQNIFNMTIEKAEKLSACDRMEFLNRSRKPFCVTIRHAIIIALVENGWTFKKIGFLLGNYDHSTISYVKDEYEDAQYVFERTGVRSDVIDLAESLTAFVRNNTYERKGTIFHAKTYLNMTKQGSSLYAIVGCI